jgi:protein disulfide-isomerase
MKIRLLTFRLPALPPQNGTRWPFTFCKSISWISFVVFAWGGLVQGIPAQASEWLTDFPAAQTQARLTGKFVLLHFSGSDWCGWCMKLRKEVFGKPEFGSYAQTNLVLVRIDFPKHTPLPAGLQKANQQLAERFHVRGYPTLILLNSQGRRLGTISYGHGGTKQFLSDVEKVLRTPNEEPSPDVLTGRGSKFRRPPGERNGGSSTNLTLRRISGSKQRREVLINNQVLSAGEAAKVRLPTGDVIVRCLEIREKSVIVMVNGKERRELLLATGT